MNQKKQQFNINGRDFLPLVLAEYPILFDLLELNLNPKNPLADIPIDLLQRVLELVQSKCLDDISDISPIELLSSSYQYINHHVELIGQHKRILSFDEQQRVKQENHVHELIAAGMEEEAKKLQQALYQEGMQDRADNRAFNRQLKELAEESGKNALNLLQWCMSISQSEVTSLSVSELMQMEWAEFISFSNQAQILSNLQQAAKQDQEAKAKLLESQRQQQQQRF